MHIILKNQVTKEVEGILCVEREAHTAIVLHSDIDRLDDLVAIARGMKVPNVRLIVPKAAVEQLEAYGWKPVADLVVLSKI
jgi:hypothetical protein